VTDKFSYWAAFALASVWTLLPLPPAAAALADADDVELPP
jgi:hypothetical protein